MRSLIRVLLAGLLCAGVAAGAVVWLLNLGSGTSKPPHRQVSPPASEGREAAASKSTEPKGQPVVYDIVLDKFEDGGYSTAMGFMAPIRDRASLAEIRESVRCRGPRGISALRAK
jgi:hypothetical protein